MFVLGEAACAVAVRVMGRSRWSGHATSGNRAKSCRSLSFDDEACRFHIPSLKPVGACQWQINPRRATVRTNFHIATGLRIIHFAGGAK